MRPGSTHRQLQLLLRRCQLAADWVASIRPQARYRMHRSQLRLHHCQRRAGCTGCALPLLLPCLAGLQLGLQRSHLHMAAASQGSHYGKQRVGRFCSVALDQQRGLQPHDGAPGKQPRMCMPDPIGKPLRPVQLAVRLSCED